MIKYKNDQVCISEFYKKLIIVGARKLWGFVKYFSWSYFSVSTLFALNTFKYSESLDKKKIFLIEDSPRSPQRKKIFLYSIFY